MGLFDPNPPGQPLNDGWLGTRELPGYRAGNVVAKLDDLPGVDPDHLYFDVLLLDDGGRTEDNHSGPCVALARERSPDERSRFVRVVAELMRHACDDSRGLAAAGQALSFVREQGIGRDRLAVAAQLLDDGCNEGIVSRSLDHLLERTLGEQEAHRMMSDVVVNLASESGFGSFDGDAPIRSTRERDFDQRVDVINRGGLPMQVSFVVRSVGKAHARRYLRQVTALDMVPEGAPFEV